MGALLLLTSVKGKHIKVTCNQYIYGAKTISISVYHIVLEDNSGCLIISRIIPQGVHQEFYTCK